MIPMAGDQGSILYFPKAAFSKRFGKQFFTMDIVGFELVDQDSCFGKHAVYHILIKQGKFEWNIKRRFKEFDSLYSSYKSSKSDSLAALPPKTCFRVTDDENFLKERQHRLYDFLDSLLKDLSQRNLLSDEKVVQFLELDPNVLTEEK
mmetsp:Transcript_14484/g.15660  ORF Transcript_14484/g.15660 Transcript_14484/m.15660 type:complete len:148 (-) Transcript_14484:162-605(-)